MWSRHLWELIWELARTDFKLRYSGAKAGYLWAVLKPIATFLIINFVFSNVFRSVDNYPLQLLTGIIMWSFFTEGTRAGMTALSSKSALLLRVPLPLMALLMAQLLHVAIIALINIVILGGFFLFYGVTPSLAALIVLAVFYLITAILILGFSLIAAPAFVHYRDVGQIWDIALRLGFYAAPIMYPLSVVPERFQRLLWINPMSYVIHNAKEALIAGYMLPASHLAIVLLVVIAAALACGLVFQHTSRNLTDHL